MEQLERQQTVLNILQNLRGLDGLKKLFWEELNYERENKPLSPRQWPDSAKQALADDPILFASGGEDNAFHIVYCRLNSDALLRGLERPVVNRLMKDHPYALIIFSNKTMSHWHFLNVKYSDEVEKRRLIRRITIGPGERLRTAAQRVQLLDLKGIEPELFALSPMTIQDRCDEAFDVEAVTKEFFKKFAELYHRVSDDIAEVRGMEKFAGNLAQLILDRMIFLYFIQKKGWLNQQPDYLYDRFLECWRSDPRGSTYYTNVLYPLFLCLSDASQSFDKLGAVPFLNGGLFEESVQQSQGERLAQARLQIKNRTFKAVFDELLENFNFTVTEDTPLDVEVAIDPEMLGKIFESLILQLEKDPDKDLRKLTGSYYTPRTIVHFMCQEVLKEYLVQQVETKDDKTSSDLRDNIHQLLELPPADQVDDDQIAELDKLFTESQAKILKQAILDCRVCDPAVGSGAFPVGMLHEMTAAVARLDVRLAGKDRIARRNYDYDLKKQVVEACLYGVDIQEQAVRLCELRLWLSLVVDYQIDTSKPFPQAIREVPSLPNLSYRIMRGDSLLERLFGHVVQLDHMAKDPKSKQLIESIQADKQAYFREANTAEKRHLELKILAKQIDLAERLVDAKKKAREGKGYQQSIFGDESMPTQERDHKHIFERDTQELSDLSQKVSLAKTKVEGLLRHNTKLDRGDLESLRRQYFHTGDSPSFMWRVDFAEIFSRSGGFDIVIGNPPWGIPFTKEQKTVFRTTYQVAQGIIDSFALFIERGNTLLGGKGILSMILPDILLLKAYPATRKYLLDRYEMKWATFWGMAFEDVSLDTCTIIARQEPNANIRSQNMVSVITDINTADVRCNARGIPQKTFEASPDYKFNLFWSQDTESLKVKLENNAQRFSDLFHSHEGIHSGNIREKLFVQTKQDRFCRPLIFGRDEIRPFGITWAGKYVRYNDGVIDRSSGEYANLAKETYFTHPKIFVRRTGDFVMAAVDRNGYFASNNLFVCVPREPSDLDYISAILNSRVMTWYFRCIQPRVGRLFAELKIVHLNTFPIRYAAPTLIAQVTTIAKKLKALAENGSKSDSSELQAKLNALVYNIYELNHKDVELIEKTTR